MISIKSKREIELMREAGKIVGECHLLLKDFIKPGVTTLEIDQLIENHILSYPGAYPIFKGYNGFPNASCCSVNEQVVHGIPNNIPLKEGDIVSVDIGVKYNGYVGDSAWSYPVGKISKEKEMLLEETKNALFAGLSKIKEGVHLSDISHEIEKHANKYKLGIVRNFAGHGVGNNLHEEPEILNYGPAGHGPILKEGMTLAIEPMFNLGKDGVIVLKDGWTTVTIDKKPSAHFEHTILVLKDGYEILTKQ